MQYIPRNLWPSLKKELHGKGNIVLTGPRRVGKTTTLKWLFTQIKSNNKIILDIENLKDRQIFEKTDYNDIIDDLEAIGLNRKRKMYVLIDEVQFLPGIASVVKYLYDRYDIKFILTGSSSYYLKNHFTESLAGRKRIFELLPFSFSEYLKLSGAKYKLKKLNIYNLPSKFNDFAYSSLENYYRDYLQFGGFPSVIQSRSREEKVKELDEIYSSYINKDVSSLSDFKNLTDFRKLVQLLAVRVGNRLNVNELSSVSGLSRQTVENYIEFLERTYLIKTIPVESKSPDVQNRKLKKIYFVDNGIAGINAQLSSGQIFENAVFASLRNFERVSYYEDKYCEIDFIVRTPFHAKEQNVIAIEVKETPTSADLTAVGRYAKKLNITNTRIIGSQKSAKFGNYVWGGELNFF
jgi:predicted AAA+ superfamily ATPase